MLRTFSTLSSVMLNNLLTLKFLLCNLTGEVSITVSINIFSAPVSLIEFPVLILHSRMGLLSVSIAILSRLGSPFSLTPPCHFGFGMRLSLPHVILFIGCPRLSSKTLHLSTNFLINRQTILFCAFLAAPVGLVCVSTTREN